MRLPSSDTRPIEKRRNEFARTEQRGVAASTHPGRPSDRLDAYACVANEPTNKKDTLGLKRTGTDRSVAKATRIDLSCVVPTAALAGPNACAGSSKQSSCRCPFPAVPWAGTPLP